MNMKPAPIFKRILASIIDTILLSTLWLVVKLLVSPLHSAELILQDYVSKNIKSYLEHSSSFAFEALTRFPSTIKPGLILLTTSSIIGFIYVVYFEQSKWQGTIGKRLLKLKVVDISNKRLSLLNASKRYLIYIAPTLVRYMTFFLMYGALQKTNITFLLATIGFYLICLITGWLLLLPIFFTKNKVTAYDMLSKTKVVG
jgi:uncharacterized RDD family membrane protein YckC